MSAEKMTIEQAIQRLSEINHTNDTRLAKLEEKLETISQDTAEHNKHSSARLTTEMTTLETNVMQRMEKMQVETREWQIGTLTKLDESQQQWNLLTDVVREMRNEIKRIGVAITSTSSSNNVHPPTDEYPASSVNHRETSTPNELSNSIASLHNSITQTNQLNAESNSNIQATHMNIPLTHTIVIPPTSAIPIFHGKTVENPHQFLIRIKEYAETVNQWTENALLNGISQFLRETALEWYCQVRLSGQRPQSWIEFRVMFLAQFNSPIRRARQGEEWKECKQGENETINEFVVRLRSLWNQTKPKETESDLIRHLMCKMRTDLLSMIGISRCETLGEIIKEAQQVEEILYQRDRQRRRTNQAKQGSLRDKTSLSSYHNDIASNYRSSSQYANHNYEFNDDRNNGKSYNNNNTNQSRRSNNQFTQGSSTVQCYGCGMYGHIKPDCPGRYDSSRQQQNWNNFSKNTNGARVGRDNDAPM